MNEVNIRKYAEIMNETGLTGLEISEGEMKVRLERSAGAHIQAQPAPLQTIQTAAAPVTAPQESTDYISIKSPMVGVFYAAPAENADPFVTAGDTVEKGTTLCIIEAMKLMNEISAEENCVIEQVCVANGQVVEYGTELFRIRRQ